MAVDLRETEAALGRLSSGEFERLANEFVRDLHPTLMSSGATWRDESAPFPVDGLGYEPGDPGTWIFVASTTTQEDDLAEKWVGHGQEANDIKKAGIALEQNRAYTPAANGKVYLALSYRLGKRANLWARAIAEGELYGLEVEPVDVTSIVSYLDTTPRGQYMREKYLSIPGELLTLELFREVSRRSIERLRTTVAIPLSEPSHEVRREATDAVVTTLLETTNRLVGIHGNAGIGKTMVLAQVGEALNAAGAIALWIPAHLFQPGLSLETLLLRSLQQIRPGLHFTAGKEALRIAAGLSGGLVILVDDVNREENPKRTLSTVVSTLDPTNVDPSDSESCPASLVRSLVPLWPGNRPRDGGPSDTVAKGWILIDLDVYSRGEQSALADAHGMTSAQSRTRLALVGGDPFLCALLLREGGGESGESVRLSIRTAFNVLLNEVADDASRIAAHATPGQVLTTLDKLVEYMLAAGEFEPEWDVMCNTLESHDAELLDAVARGYMLASVVVDREPEIWRWKHVRLRDFVVGRRLARHMTVSLKSGRPSTDLVSLFRSPGLAEACAIALIFLDDKILHSHFNEILGMLSPLSHAEALRLQVFPSDSEGYASLINSLRNVVHSRVPGHQEFVTDERWYVVSKLNETHSPAVLEILGDAPGGMWERAALIRNGDVNAALGWISWSLERESFPPDMGNDLIESAFAEMAAQPRVAERASSLLADPLDTIDVSAAVLLAGYLGLQGIASTGIKG